MHPVIRVVSFLLFCIALARPDQEQLILAGLLITVLLSRCTFAQLTQSLRMVRRLRWLLFSVLVIYGWFTPGLPVSLPLPDSLLPTRIGLETGLLRGITLILILLAAGLLLVTTSRVELIAALYWLLAPLRYLGLQPERFAVRLSLTLAYVDQQQEYWCAPPPPPQERLQGRINRIARHLGSLLPRLFEQATEQPRQTVVLELPAPPGLIQWGWPVVLCAGFILSAFIEL
ncbi:MAG: hypothetical protein ACQESY_03465 [Pseudomonadota bacterium]